MNIQALIKEKYSTLSSLVHYDARTRAITIDDSTKIITSDPKLQQLLTQFLDELQTVDLVINTFKIAQSRIEPAVMLAIANLLVDHNELTVVDFSHSTFDEGALKLFCTRLDELNHRIKMDFKYCGLKAVDIKEIGKLFGYFDAVELTGNPLGEAGMIELVNAIELYGLKTITTIHCESCALSSQAISRLINFLMSQANHITKLFLNNNYCSHYNSKYDNKLDLAAAKALASYLQQPNVAKIIGISSLTDDLELLKTIMSGAERSTDLQEISLSKGQIQAILDNKPAAQQLFAAIKADNALIAITEERVLRELGETVSTNRNSFHSPSKNFLTNVTQLKTSLNNKLKVSRALFTAVSQGNVPDLQRLISKNPTTTLTRDPETGFSLLHFAVIQQLPEAQIITMLNMLLHYGYGKQINMRCKQNQGSNTALHLSAQSGKTEVYNFLAIQPKVVTTMTNADGLTANELMTQANQTPKR